MRKFLHSRTGWLLGLIGLALIAPGLAFATPISITNFSFEADKLDPGGQTNGVITGWTLTAPDIGSEGVLCNNGNFFPVPPGLPDGVNFAWSNGGTISQVLADTLKPGYYSLQVYVGHRADLSAWPPYAVQLYAGGQLLAQESSLTPAGGTFALSTVTYRAALNDPYLGQPLEIRLVTNASQTSFDKVTLNYFPNYVPLLLLLGSGTEIPGTPEVLATNYLPF
jgi:hypothetical protein